MALHTDLPIYRTGVRLLDLAVKVQVQMPRTVKRALGEKITQHCVDMLDLMAQANATQRETRAGHIDQLLTRQRAVTVLLRVSHDARYISPKLWADSIELLGIDNVEAFVHQLMTIKAWRPDDGDGTVLVQFVYRERNVSVKASIKGYATAWLKEHPFTNRTRGSLAQHQRKAMDIASIAVYSILRDWIKGQITAIETGILTFEGAFLGQILLASGKTVLEHSFDSKILPALEGPSK